MTICEFLIALATGIVGSVVATYVVRFLDKRHKNDRHSPKHGH